MRSFNSLQRFKLIIQRGTSRLKGKVNLKQYCTTKPTPTPAAEPTKEKPIVFGVIAAALLGNIGWQFSNEIYPIVYLSKNLEVTPECDGYAHSQWSSVHAAVTTLSSFEPLVKADVIGKAIKQLNLAADELVKTQDPVRELKLLHLISTIEKSLGVFCQAEYISKEFVQKGGVETVHRLFQILPQDKDNSEAALINLVLWNVILSQPTLQWELSKNKLTAQIPHQQVEVRPSQNFPFEVKKEVMDMSHLIPFGVAAALYCAVRWRLKSPTIPVSVLMKRAMLGFIGCAIPPVIEKATFFFDHNASALKAVNDRLENNKQASSLYSPEGIMGVVYSGRLAQTIIFLVPFYYAKYLLFPSLFGEIIFVTLRDMWQVYREQQRQEQQQEQQQEIITPK